MPVFAPPSVMFVRGKGTELFDIEGRRYLDFLSGIAVTSLGHAHPVVAEAIATQAHELLHVSNYFANPTSTAAAVAVNQLLGEATGESGKTFFTNSGAESIECALKLGRKFGGRGRHVVVSAFGSFHGRTLAALAATGQPAKHEPFSPMPEGFKHVVWGDVDALRGRGRRNGRRRADRADPGRGRGQPGATRLPGGDPRPVRPHRGVDDRRRDPDRPRSHGRVVRLPARRRRARRGRPGQGARKRHARRRLLGQGLGRRGVRTGRPRQHVQRDRHRHVGRERGDRRDASHRRTAPGARPRCRARRVAGRTPRSQRGPRPRAAPRRRADRPRRSRRVPRPARRGARRQRGRADRDPAGPADHGVGRRDPRGGRQDRPGARHEPAGDRRPVAPIRSTTSSGWPAGRSPSSAVRSTARARR